MKALIISKTEASLRAIAQMLKSENYDEIDCITAVEIAKDRLSESEYDAIVINTPLENESGLDFSVYCAERTKACVILIVQQERSVEAFNAVESHGVLVISKPINKHLFHHYLIFTQCFKERLLAFERENEKLKSKLEEVSVINRAKLLLIQCLSMTEQQAHRYLEKQAMNMRTSKVSIAKQVIRTYEN